MINRPVTWKKKSIDFLKKPLIMAGEMLEKIILKGAKIYVLKKAGISNEDFKTGNFEVFKRYEAGIKKHLSILGELIGEYQFKVVISDEILNYLIINGYDMVIPEEMKTKEVVLRMLSLRYGSIIPGLKKEFLNDKDVFFTYVMGSSIEKNTAQKMWAYNFFDVEAQKDVEMISLLASEYNVEVLTMLHPDLKKDGEFQLSLVNSFTKWSGDLASLQKQKSIANHLMPWFKGLDKTLLNDKEFVKKFLFKVEMIIRNSGGDVDSIGLFKTVVGKELLNDDAYLIESLDDIKKTMMKEEEDYFKNENPIASCESESLKNLIWNINKKRISLFSPSNVTINEKMIETVIEEYENWIKKEMEIQKPGLPLREAVWVNSIMFFICAMIDKKSKDKKYLFSRTLLSRMAKNPVILKGMLSAFQKTSVKNGGKVFNIEGLKTVDDVILYIIKEELLSLDSNNKTLNLDRIRYFCKNNEVVSIKIWKFCLKNRIVSMSDLDNEMLSYSVFNRLKVRWAKKLGLLSGNSYLENMSEEEMVNEILNPNLKDKGVLKILLAKNVLSHNKIMNYTKTTFNGINDLDNTIARILSVGLAKKIPNYLWDNPDIIKQVLYRLLYSIGSSYWEKNLEVPLKEKKELNKYIPEEHKNGYLYYLYVYKNFIKDKKMMKKYSAYFENDDMWLSIIFDKNIKDVSFNILFPKEILLRPSIKNVILTHMTATELNDRFDDISFLEVDEQRDFLNNLDTNFQVGFFGKSGCLLGKYEDDVLKIIDNKSNVTKLIMSIDESLIKSDKFIVKLIDKLMDMNYFYQQVEGYYREFALDKFLWNDEIKNQFNKTYGIVSVMEIYKENPCFLRDLVVNSEVLKMENELNSSGDLLNENPNLKQMLKF